MPPLTYLSNSAILRYLPIHKRRELSKKIPSLRVAYRKVPYRLNDVSISIHSSYITLRLDNSDISYDVKYFNGEIPPGDIGTRNNLLKKLLKYFFNRPGTSVNCLSIVNVDDSEWCKKNDFNEVQLKIGYLDLSQQKMNKQCNMELFKNSQFTKIHLTIHNLEDIDRIKRLESSRNAHCFIDVFNIHGIDLQSIIDKLNESGLKYTLELNGSLFRNFLESLKTSRSYPLFTVKSTLFLWQLTESQLKDMGGVKSFVTKDCKIQCYTFPTSDPQKEVVVTWEECPYLDGCDYEAKVQKSGTSVQCADNITN